MTIESTSDEKRRAEALRQMREYFVASGYPAEELDEEDIEGGLQLIAESTEKVGSISTDDIVAALAQLPEIKGGEDPSGTFKIPQTPAGITKSSE